MKQFIKDLKDWILVVDDKDGKLNNDDWFYIIAIILSSIAILYFEVLCKL